MMQDSDLMSNSEDGRTPQQILNTIIKIDFAYFTNSWIGRIKLAELICVTLAGIILPSVIGVFFTRYSFFTFIIWTSFMYISIDLMLHVTSLWERLPQTCRSSSILMYPLLIGALAFLIGSALVASTSDLLFGSRATRSGVSAGFGFVTMVLYIVEAVLHYQNTRVNVGGHTASIQRRHSNPSSIVSEPQIQYPPAYNTIESSSQKKEVGSYDGRFV